MIYILLNIGPILAATLVGLVLGFLALRAIGEKIPSPLAILGIALAEFWLASILAGALILAPVESDPWTIALGTAFIIWVGFVLPVVVVSGLATKQGWKLSLWTGGYWLTVMLGQAAVLHAMGLVAPPS